MTRPVCLPKPHWSKKLEALYACREAVEYAKTKPSLAAAWRDCERGDWMLWLVGKSAGRGDSPSRKRLVGAVVDCAALARKFTSGETRRTFDRCQRTTRRYLNGEASLSEVRVAASAAYAAAYDAYAAANAAADAASATASATYAAAYADAATAAYAAAAASATYAAAYAANADARVRILKRCAAIVRKHCPKPPRLRGAE
jgi:hypothetical protein